MLPHRFGRRERVLGQPFVAAAGRDHAEAGGARPVDEIADERRLVAIRQAVNDPGLRRAARKQRSAERVGLDRHHDDVLPGRERLEGVRHRRRRIAGHLDDDVERWMADKLVHVVADMRRTRSCGLIEALRRDLLNGPARLGQRLSCTRHREIG